MNSAEAIATLKENFETSIIDEIEFHGELTIEVTKGHLKGILLSLKQMVPSGYTVLMDLTAVDYLKPTKRTKVVYLLHNPTNFERIRVTVFVEREEPLPSVTDIWAGAEWYEREIWDLFGVWFEGNPDMKRILMPDDWEGHPLRKDYALTEVPVQFKHGVKPKVPSEIIGVTKASKNIK